MGKVQNEVIIAACPKMLNHPQNEARWLQSHLSTMGAGMSWETSLWTIYIKISF